MELDISESAPARASRTLRAFTFSTMRGFVVALAFTGAGGAIALAIFAPSHAGELVGVTVSGLIEGALVYFLFAFALFLVLSPRWQREEARARLGEIKREAEWLSVHTVPETARQMAEISQKGHLVVVTIENMKRGAQYAVVLERLDGTEEPLQDPFIHLYWGPERGPCRGDSDRRTKETSGLATDGDRQRQAAPPRHDHL
jgi:hypothetical protein